MQMLPNHEAISHPRYRSARGLAKPLYRQAGFFLGKRLDYPLSMVIIGLDFLIDKTTMQPISNASDCAGNKAFEPTISVIIPIFNMESYLARCLDSILGNTYRKLEIICVNDGSGDHSLGILKKYEEKDSRVRVFSKSNGGVTSARNMGLDNAHGEWIAFVDPDDWVHPQYFELMILAWRKSGRKAKIVASGFDKVSAYREDCKYQGIPDGCMRSITWNNIIDDTVLSSSLWMRMYRREIVQGFRLPNEYVFAEDITTNLTLLGRMQALEGVWVYLPLYHYFMRENSAVHTLSVAKKLPALQYFSDMVEGFPSKEARQACCEVALQYIGYILLIRGKGNKSLWKQARLVYRKLMSVWLNAGPQTNGRLLSFTKHMLWYSLPTMHRWYCMKRNPKLKQYIRQEADRL